MQIDQHRGDISRVVQRVVAAALTVNAARNCRAICKDKGIGTRTAPQTHRVSGARNIEGINQRAAVEQFNLPEGR